MKTKSNVAHIEDQPTFRRKRRTDEAQSIYLQSAIDELWADERAVDKVKRAIALGPNVPITVDYRTLQRAIDQQTEMYETMLRTTNIVLDSANGMVRKLIKNLIEIGQGARSDETAQQALNRLTRTAYSALIVDGTYKTVDEAFEKALKVA